MPLETANYIFDLVPTNPPDTDLVQQGDDHIRLIKKVIQQTWPALTGPNLPTSTGSANAHIVTHVYGPTAYVAGQIVTFKAGFTNTGPTTINVNGGGPVTLSQGGAALTANALVAGNNYTMIYDPSVTGFALIASSMGYLPLFGGTLTGNLIISTTTGPTLTLSGPGGAGNPRSVYGQTNGSNRWVVVLGNGIVESGSNVGSDFGITRYSDAGAVIDSPLVITRSTGQVAIKGTSTNDSAAAGYVGEIISSIVLSPGVTLTTATTANVATITLTPGDWDISGELYISVGTGGATFLAGGLSATSGALPAVPNIAVARSSLWATFPATVLQTLNLGPTRYGVAASTVYYMTCQVAFPSGTTTAYGKLSARRMR